LHSLRVGKIQTRLDTLCGGGEIIIGTIERMSGKWAEALENLGDAIEDNIEFFSVDFLEQIQVLALDLIQISRHGRVALCLHND
jgi:hypothetical protein